uniref:Uncharacterized protein n=1 Tax=Anguilla anguilla TaxID=7936 RepID=A0A0E9RLC8_ANGAN
MLRWLQLSNDTGLTVR